MFEKHCQICGMDVKKETATKRFGKYFCNNEHAEEFTQQEKARQERESREPRRSGGCC
jgi:uncharacterized protein